MISSIDHVVILVEDLDRGIQQYRDLGFTVIPGGKHPRFTHNALVSFADGSYLELIAFWETTDPAAPDVHRWQKHLEHGGGLIDFALAVAPLEEGVAAIASRGIAVDGPYPGARSRPDGVQVAWKGAAPAEKQPGSLPFMIEDVTERSVRVPGGEAVIHANGVRGIQTLTIVVGDSAEAGRRYAAMLGTQGEPSASGTRFQIGPHQVVLLQPEAGSAAAAQLAQRGDSLFELTFVGDNDAVYGPDVAGNARLRVVAG
ncbi:MAG: VOC family protein [Chloroflexi bacterium]|nr:MAG: VOC family protein [Chloroflexota bacterium]